MSAIADITVYDSAALGVTPVSHVLKAVGASNKDGLAYAQWRENVANVPEYAQIVAEMWLSRSKAGTRLPRLRVTIPIQEVVTGSNSAGYSAAPKVAHNVTIECSGFFSPRATTQDRMNAVGILTNILRGNGASTTFTEGGGPGGSLFHWIIPVA